MTLIKRTNKKISVVKIMRIFSVSQLLYEKYALTFTYCFVCYDPYPILPFHFASSINFYQGYTNSVIDKEMNEVKSYLSYFLCFGREKEEVYIKCLSTKFLIDNLGSTLGCPKLLLFKVSQLFKLKY